MILLAPLKGNLLTDYDELPTSSIFTPSVQPKFSEWLHKQISPEWILYPQKFFATQPVYSPLQANLKTALLHLSGSCMGGSCNRL